MADIYFGTGGSAGGDGSLGNPYDTFANAKAASASVDDRLIMLTGTTESAPANYFQFADGASNARTVKSQGFRDATLQAHSSHAVRVLYISSTIAATDEAVIEGLILDCEDGRVDSGIDISASDTTPPSHIRISNVLVQEPDEEGIKFPNTRATDIEVFNCKVEKLLTPAANVAFTPLALGSYTLGANAAQRVRVHDLDLDIEIGALSWNGIRLESRQAVNSVTANVSGLRGTVKNTDTGRNMTVLDVTGIPGAVVSNCDLVVDNPNGVENWGIRVKGYSAGVPADNAVVVGNKIDFIATGGYGIEFGDSTDVSHMSGGTFSANYVKGRYYASNTPHGLSLGEDTTGTMYGNIVEDMFAAFLISLTDSAEVFGNLAVNPYGSAFYAKGTQASTTIRNNVVVLRESANQRARGLLEATFQSESGGVPGTYNTANAAFEDNLVIVESIDALGATGTLPAGRTDNGRTTGHLASKYDLNQAGVTFSRNTYVLPDTVDVSTAELFNYEQEGVGVGYCTLDTWNNQTGITDERIILLPQNQVNALIAHYENIATAASGEAGGGNGSFGIGI